MYSKDQKEVDFMFKKALRRFFSTIIVILLIMTTSSIIVQADDGTPYNGPHNVPGTIQT